MAEKKATTKAAAEKKTTKAATEKKAAPKRAAKITENEALLGMGWLFKEGKITDEEGLIKLA